MDFIMANDLFGGLGNLGGLGDTLGGLMGGLAKSGLLPKDTPEGKIMAAQADLTDFQKKESELLLEIGKKAYEQDPQAWPQDSKLKLIRENIRATQEALDSAKQEQKQANAVKAAEDAKGRCPACGHKNTDGVKFCQECGSPLGAPAKTFCGQCGAQLAPGTRFCGECGAGQSI